ERAARRHVGTDRSAVTAVLVGAVRLHAAAEAPTTDDAGEAAPARRAARVDELADLEELVELHHRADLELGGEMGGAAKLFADALRRGVQLLDLARHRLRRVLLFAILEAEDEGRIAVLLGRPLREDRDRARLDDGDAVDVAVLAEELGAADLTAV